MFDHIDCYRNVLVPNDSGPKIRHAYDWEMVGEFISSILSNDSTRVQIRNLVGIGDRTNKNVEPRSCRLLTVISG